MTTRRRLLQAGLAAGAVFLPAPFAWVWAQSGGATRLLRAPKRALVIGNSAYLTAGALINPGRDARAIAAALTESGFAVTLVLDASRARMQEAIRAYVEELAARKSVGLFYYAGHGLQLAWRNFLVPVDAAIEKLDDVAAHCVDVTDLVRGIRTADNPMNVIILDACRENPFTGVRVEQKGLSQMDAPPGTLLAYATAPGNLAADGQGANGLYTENLLREMRVREAKIEDVFKRVRLNVRLASLGKQIPWESTSLEEDFYFLPPEQLRKLSQEEEERVFAEERALFEQAQEAREAARLEQYLRRYPSGRFVELAQLLLDRQLAAKGERPVQIASSVGNPNTLGSARANTDYKVGDVYVYRQRDLRSGNERDARHRITAITDDRVIINDGRMVLDLLGNLVQLPDGRSFTTRQDLPLEYVVGKRWTTRFETLTGPRTSGRPPLGGGDGRGPNSTGTVEIDYRIAARESLTVPAGTFECFRIEGRGLNTAMFRPPVEVSITFWRAPDKLRRNLAVEEKRYFKQNVQHWERNELVSFRES